MRAAQSYRFRCPSCTGGFTYDLFGWASAHLKSCVIRMKAPPELHAMRVVALGRQKKKRKR